MLIFLCSVGAASAAVVVSSNPTKNMSCSAGVCTPTAAKANLNITDLANMLASSDLTVAANSAGATIQFAAPLSWTSSHWLTLDSARDITIHQPIAVAGVAGVTLITNDGGTGGELEFEAPGRVEFWDTSSSLVINGNAYTLVKSLRALARVAAKNPAGFYALAENHDAAKEGTYAAPPVPGSFDGVFEGLHQAFFA